MDKQFILTCDSSDVAVGFVLGQFDSENKEYVIAYGNKTLTKEEKKYTTSEKELLAILKGVEAFRPYISNNHFTIVTDHRALIWLKTAKHTGRLTRWMIKLQELQFDIIHRSGKSNVVADCLSRIPNPLTTNIDVISASIPNSNSQNNSDDMGAEVTLYYKFDHLETSYQHPAISVIDLTPTNDPTTGKNNLS